MKTIASLFKIPIKKYLQNQSEPLKAYVDQNIKNDGALFQCQQFKIKKMNTIFLFYLGLFLGNCQTTETVDLQIVVTNIHSIKGNIELGIFKDSKTFLEIGKEYKTYSKKVINDSLIFTLNGVAKGNYAISVYHDKNSDKKCNLNFLGIPVESYGFSQNYKPTIRKPTFEECKITANKNMSIPIKLID